MNKQKLVKEFHTKFAHPAPNKLQHIPYQRALLRYKLIQEETEELYEALMNRDQVETLDALCDILYVTYGAAVECGFSVDQINKAFNEVHSSNMSKLGEDGKPIYNKDGKVLKGKNYFKPNLKQFI